MTLSSTIQILFKVSVFVSLCEDVIKVLFLSLISYRCCH